MKINYSIDIEKLNISAIVLIVILTLMGCSSQIEESDWVKDNLKGKVQTYTEFSYKAEDRFGKIEKGKRKTDHSWTTDLRIKYNEKGKQIEENYYNSDASLDRKEIYKYDEKENHFRAKWIKTNLAG